MRPRSDAVGTGEVGPVAWSEEPPPLQLPRGRSHRVLSLVAAAVVALTGVGLTLTHHSTPPISAVAALHYLDALWVVTGEAAGRTVSSTRQMEVAIQGLPAAPVNHYYEVRPLQSTTNKMLPVGVLRGSMRGV